MWWHTTLSPARGRPRQASLVYVKTSRPTRGTQETLAQKIATSKSYNRLGSAFRNIFKKLILKTF